MNSRGRYSCRETSEEAGAGIRLQDGRGWGMGSRGAGRSQWIWDVLETVLTRLAGLNWMLG